MFFLVFASRGFSFFPFVVDLFSFSFSILHCDEISIPPRPLGAPQWSLIDASSGEVRRFLELGPRLVFKQ